MVFCYGQIGKIREIGFYGQIPIFQGIFQGISPIFPSIFKISHLQKAQRSHNVGPPSCKLVYKPHEL